MCHSGSVGVIHAVFQSLGVHVISVESRLVRSFPRQSERVVVVRQIDVLHLLCGVLSHVCLHHCRHSLAGLIVSLHGVGVESARSFIVATGEERGGLLLSELLHERLAAIHLHLCQVGDVLVCGALCRCLEGYVGIVCSLGAWCGSQFGHFARCIHTGNRRDAYLAYEQRTALLRRYHVPAYAVVAVCLHCDDIRDILLVPVRYVGGRPEYRHARHFRSVGTVAHFNHVRRALVVVACRGLHHVAVAWFQMQGRSDEPVVGIIVVRHILRHILV